MAVAQDQLALQLMAADPIRIKRIAFAISIATTSLAGAFLIIIQPVEPSIGRDYIGGCSRSACSGASAACPEHCSAPCCSAIVESFTATFYGPSWAPAVSFGLLLLTLAFRPAGLAGAIDGRPAMNSAIRSGTFVLACAVVAALVFAGARAAGNDYVFFAGYTILQFIVLATAWNILGGYTGYVNFGTRGVLRARRLCDCVLPQILPDACAGAAYHRRRRVGSGGTRHGLSDVAASRGVLRHRDARARRRAADPGGQLELCRRRAGRLL